MLPCPSAARGPSGTCLPMTESISQPVALRAPGLARRRSAGARSTAASSRRASGSSLLGNLAAILYITLFSSSGDALNYHWTSFDSVLIGMGRLTAFLAGYFALIEVILLARRAVPRAARRVRPAHDLAPLERPRGHLPRRSRTSSARSGATRSRTGSTGSSEYWHWLTLPQPKAPGSFTAVERRAAAQPRASTWGRPTTSPYPGIITATIGTFLLVVVLVTSLVIVRRKLSYEWWYAIHFTAYAGIALAWFHMIPDGNELIANMNAADYWRASTSSRWCSSLWYRLVLADRQHVPVRDPGRPR